MSDLSAMFLDIIQDYSDDTLSEVFEYVANADG
jgi:hypothetical protein